MVIANTTLSPVPTARSITVIANLAAYFTALLCGFGSADLMAAQTTDYYPLYQKYCSVCHGDKGDADTRAAGSLNPRPRNFTAPEAAQELSRERMIKSVTNGRPGTAMVGHAKKLSPQQIEGIVDFIRASFMRIGAEGIAPAVTQQGAANAQGRQIYRKNCAPCHGDDGNTAVWARGGLNPPPRDFTSSAARTELTRERMIQSVTHGRPGTAMMPFASRLTANEIQTVVGYIRANFMHVDDGAITSATATQPGRREPHEANNQDQISSSSATNSTMGPTGDAVVKADMKLPMPNKLKGNVKAGESFYTKNCFTCHGLKGDGNGPRAYFITPRPRNFTIEQSREFYNRPRLFDAITHGKRGTPMPAWGKVLSDQQIADVAEYVFQAFIKGSIKVSTPDQSSDDVKKKGG